MRSRSHKHKFNATRISCQSGHFASKLEHKYFIYLEWLKKAQLIAFFLRQVPFHLPGNIKYIVDFQVFWANGEVTFEDVKGFETKEFIMKKKLVESIYPLDIKVIKEGDF